MNKKANIYKLLYTTIIIILLFGGIYFFGTIAKQEWIRYNAYKEFCDERPNFCYCSGFECDYKVSSWTSTSTLNGEIIENSEGMSKESEELCELAKELNDKKMLFKVGCL